jgi:hypothetical protein
MRENRAVYVCNQCEGKPCVVVTDYSDVNHLIDCAEASFTEMDNVLGEGVLAALMNEQARLVK